MVELFGAQINVELLAVIVSLLLVIFQVYQRSILWLFSIASAILYAIVYIDNRLYVLLGMSLYNLIISVYGSCQYLSVKKKLSDEGKDSSIQIRKLTSKVAIISIVLLICGTIILSLLNSRLGTSYPICDAFLGVISMLGIFYLSKQYIENWYVWLVCDTLSVIFYIYIGLYWSAFLYLVYVGICVVGLRKWKKQGVRI